MSAATYTTYINGVETVVSATDTSSGTPSAGAMVALNSTGSIDPSMLGGSFTGNIDCGTANSVFGGVTQINCGGA